jgi:hypothetical protein
MADVHPLDQLLQAIGMKVSKRDTHLTILAVVLLDLLERACYLDTPKRR